MSSDLIASVVAITLAIAVVALGLKRNLSQTTRDGLPRFGVGSGRATATPGLYEGQERRRRPLSPRQRRWMSGGFLLFGLSYAIEAILWADDRLIHAVFAALWMVIAATYFWEKWPSAPKRPTS